MNSSPYEVLFSELITLQLVLGVGSVGWLLGILCLFIRFRPGDSWLCLASDIVSKTFVAITVIGVLSLSIHIAVYLPKLSQKEDLVSVAKTTDISPPTDIRELLGNQGTLLADISTLHARIQPRALSDTLIDLHRDEDLDHEKATLAILEAMGSISEFSLYFKVRGLDYRFHCTPASKPQCVTNAG